MHASYLVAVEFFEKTDSGFIACLVNKFLRFLWPYIDSTLLKELVSDAAAYMLKAGQDLKVFFPSLVHVTCVTHGVH